MSPMPRELALLHRIVEATFLSWHSNGKNLVLSNSLACGCEKLGKRLYLVSFVSIGDLFVICSVTARILPVNVLQAQVSSIRSWKVQRLPTPSAPVLSSIVLTSFANC
jgi:hypothetical protein